MKIITNLEAMVEVAAITRQDFQTQAMAGAWTLAIPHHDWLIDTFLPYWWDWKRALGLAEGGFYQPGSGMCEWVSREFLNRLAVCARKAQAGRDWNPCAFELRCVIPKGYALNRVTDGGHAPILICTHTEKNSDESSTPPPSRRWFVAEAQSNTLADFATPLDVAAAAGVGIYSVIN